MRRSTSNPPLPSAYLRALFCISIFAQIHAANGATDALPDFAALVQVKVDGDTKALAEYIAHQRADPKQLRYRELRQNYANAPEGELELARWCRKQRLTDEEQLHWRLWLTHHPDDPEAIKALRLKPFHGTLMTAEEIEDAKKEITKTDVAAHTWEPKLKRLKRLFDHGEKPERTAAFAELMAIRDPLAIPSLESVFGYDSSVSIEIVETLAQKPGEASAMALARFATLSPTDYVRRKAAEALHDSPDHSYLPKLISSLEAPIEMSVETSYERGYPVYKSMMFEQAAARAEVQRMSSFANCQNCSVACRAVPLSQTANAVQYVGNVPDRLRHNYVLRRESSDAERPYEVAGTMFDEAGHRKSRKDDSISSLSERVRQANAEQAALNAKIHDALNTATGANVPPAHPGEDQFEDVKPKLWWDWWRQQSHAERYFNDGTLVWTQFGLTPIEEILVGDRVLTRDLNTKELTFELVLMTGHQPAGTMRALTIGSETIIAASDQQLSAEAANWRKTSDWKPGETIATLSGAKQVTTTTDAGGSEQFGLVIANTATFFVGQQAILAHDATATK